jgi:hypothetical protein
VAGLVAALHHAVSDRRRIGQGAGGCRRISPLRQVPADEMRCQPRYRPFPKSHALFLRLGRAPRSEMDFYRLPQIPGRQLLGGRCHVDSVGAGSQSVRL